MFTVRVSQPKREEGVIFITGGEPILIVSVLVKLPHGPFRVSEIGKFPGLE